MKRKLFLVTLIVILVIGSFNVDAITNKDNQNSLKDVILKHNLKAVNKVPDGVIPLAFNSVEEMNKYLSTSNRVITSTSTIEKNNEISMLTVYPTQTFNNTYKVCDVGVTGRVDSLVNYDKRYDDYLRRWVILRINYHDVFLAGFYANTTWTTFDKTATINSTQSEINVYVRGRYDVYVYVVGQQVFVKQETVQKSYVIGNSNN